MSATIKGHPAAQTAGGATATTLLGLISPVPGPNNVLRSVAFVSPSGITSADTNNVTIEIGRIRAGVRVVVASLTLTAAAGAVVANVPKAIPVTQADPSLNAPGDVIDVKLTQNGTGLAVPAGCFVQVEIF